MPEVDGFMGVADYTRLLEMMQEARGRASGRATSATASASFTRDRVLTTPSYSAYVKISDGCDNRCSYCAIPLIRGPYHSRPFDRHRRGMPRAGRARGDGNYADRAGHLPLRQRFPRGQAAAARTCSRPSAPSRASHWVRVLYCYPDTTDDRLLDAIAVASQGRARMSICRCSTSTSRLLKRMNRRGSAGVDQEPHIRLQGARSLPRARR